MCPILGIDNAQFRTRVVLGEGYGGLQPGLIKSILCLRVQF